MPKVVPLIILLSLSVNCFAAAGAPTVFYNPVDPSGVQAPLCKIIFSLAAPFVVVSDFVDRDGPLVPEFRAGSPDGNAGSVAGASLNGIIPLKRCVPSPLKTISVLFNGTHVPSSVFIPLPCGAGPPCKSMVFHSLLLAYLIALAQSNLPQSFKRLFRSDLICPTSYMKPGFLFRGGIC